MSADHEDFNSDHVTARIPADLAPHFTEHFEAQVLDKLLAGLDQEERRDPDWFRAYLRKETRRAGGNPFMRPY